MCCNDTGQWQSLTEHVCTQGTNPKALGKEAVLAWLTAAVQAGQPRTSGGEGKGVLSPQALRAGSSDRFALGVAALCLRYCRPFLPKDAAAVDRLDRQHMARLGPEFYAQHAHRSASVLGVQGLYHSAPSSPACRCMRSKACFLAA